MKHRAGKRYTLASRHRKGKRADSDGQQTPRRDNSKNPPRGEKRKEDTLGRGTAGALDGGFKGGRRTFEKHMEGRGRGPEVATSGIALAVKSHLPDVSGVYGGEGGRSKRPGDRGRYIVDKPEKKTKAIWTRMCPKAIGGGFRKGSAGACLREKGRNRKKAGKPKTAKGGWGGKTSVGMGDRLISPEFCHTKKGSMVFNELKRLG